MKKKLFAAITAVCLLAVAFTGCGSEGTEIGEDIYGGKIDTTLLRKNVGMVLQQPNPFPMSIYDNIAYG